jgi:hypothetical protein
MSDQSGRPMVVRVLINGEKQPSLSLYQSDCNNPYWFTGGQKIGNAEIYVIAGSDVDGSDAKVHFDIKVEWDVEVESEMITNGHQIRGVEQVRGIWDWESVTWRRELPVRPNFPGESPLPRTTIVVTLELENPVLTS